MTHAHITLDNSTRSALIQLVIDGNKDSRYTATNIDSLEDALDALSSRGYVIGSEPLSERGRHSVHEVVN